MRHSERNLKICETSSAILAREAQERYQVLIGCNEIDDKFVPLALELIKIRLELGRRGSGRSFDPATGNVVRFTPLYIQDEDLVEQYRDKVALAMGTATAILG